MTMSILVGVDFSSGEKGNIAHVLADRVMFWNYMVTTCVGNGIGQVHVTRSQCLLAALVVRTCYKSLLKVQRPT